MACLGNSKLSVVGNLRNKLSYVVMQECELNPTILAEKLVSQVLKFNVRKLSLIWRGTLSKSWEVSSLSQNRLLC